MSRLPYQLNRFAEPSQSSSWLRIFEYSTAYSLSWDTAKVRGSSLALLLFWARRKGTVEISRSPRWSRTAGTRIVGSIRYPYLWKVCPPTLSRPSHTCPLSVSVHHFINHCSTLIQTPCFNQNNVVSPNPYFTLGATIDKTLFYALLTIQPLKWGYKSCCPWKMRFWNQPTTLTIETDRNFWKNVSMNPWFRM